MTEAEIQRMVVRLMGDSSSLQSACKTATSAVRSTAAQVKSSEQTFQSLGKVVDRVGSQMSTFAGSFRAISALESPMQVLRDAIQLAGQAESSKINFGTMLGGEDKGAEMVERLQRFAADTPLNTPAIEKAAQLLLQYQVGAGRLIPVMRQLGDVTLGNADKFQRVALAYGQMNNAGRVTGEELGQMREAGFSPLAEMAKILRTDVAGLQKQIEQGRVPMSVMDQALKNLTSSGGKFHEGMLRGSKGIEGLFSTMQDDIAGSKRVLGEFVVEMFRLKDAIRAVSKASQEFTAWFKALDPQTKKLIASVAVAVLSFGSLIVAWNVAKIAGKIVFWVLADIAAMLGKIGGLARGAAAGFMFLLNPVNLLTVGLRSLKLVAATVLGPWGWVIAAVIALVTGLVQKAGGWSASLGKIGEGASKVWESIKTGATRAWDWVVARATAAWNWFKPYWVRFQTTVLVVWDEIVRIGTGAFSFIQGGAGSAFDWIMTKAGEFLAFVTPVFRALESLADTVFGTIYRAAGAAWAWIQDRAVQVWNVITEVWGQLGTFFGDLWASVAGPSNNFWTGIRDWAVTAIYFVEYALLNWRRVWDYVMLASAHSSVRLFNQIEYFFTTVIPTVLTWLQTNWRAIFTDIYNFTETVFQNLFDNLFDIVTNFADILSGDRSIREMWRPITAGFRATVDRLAIPDRVVGRLEAELAVDLAAAGAALGADFSTFLADRLARDAPPVPADAVIPPATVTAVQDRADEVGRDIARAINKPAEKFDATLRRGAEALSRINAFRDANRANPENRGVDWRNQAAAQQEQARLQREQLQTQRAIRRAVERSANQPNFSIMPSNFSV